jgi:hypothetical protein
MWDDRKLRKVSITTNGLLLDDNLEINPNMQQLVGVLGKKYRLYFVTQCRDDPAQIAKAQSQIFKVQNEHAGTVQKHRALYSTTAGGKMS